MTPARPLILLAAVAAVSLPAAPARAQPPTGGLDGVRTRTLQPYRGRGVTLITDLPAERAQRLVSAASESAAAAAAVLGARRVGPITLFAWDDVTVWPKEQMPQMAQYAIQGGPPYLMTNTLRRTQTMTFAGIPVEQSGREDSASMWYGPAADGGPERGAAQAVAAMVADDAPDWYADGLAELGRYYDARAGSAVRIAPGALAFLTGGPPPTPRQIAEADGGRGADPGERAQAATEWRWALAHLTAHNPNFKDRFALIGPTLAADRPVTFDGAYAQIEPQLRFEYEQFLAHLQQGLRPDLTAWDWNARPRPLGRRASVRVDARGGWQATRALVTAGDRIAYDAAGTWEVGPNVVRPAHVDPAAEVAPDAAAGPTSDAEEEEVTADGGADGRGRLVAAVFDSTTLSVSEEVELGVAGTFAAPGTGHLVLRARDEWGQLDDNRGRINVKLSPAP